MEEEIDVEEECLDVNVVHPEQGNFEVFLSKSQNKKFRKKQTALAKAGKPKARNRAGPVNFA